MTKIGEAILLGLNALLPNPHQAIHLAKQSSLTYNRFFAERSISSFAQFGKLNLTGLSVLDVGCGLGANLEHLANLGVNTITGIDISYHQIESTKTIFNEYHPSIFKSLCFVTADAAKMPFSDGSFDALVSADTFEHLDDLKATLQECARVLKPGGFLYGYFPPFYAPWGAHMLNWIKVPWCQVFFSEKTILNVARKLERSGASINNQLPPETKLELQLGNVIPFVNHITIKQFKHTVKNLPVWRIERISLLGPNWRTSHRMGWFMNLLNRIPIIQEIFTAKAVFVLQKNGDQK
jgi:ubiquinone/menaquinone biosynthesis C-methylase UbiE